MPLNGNASAHSLFISDLHLCGTRPHITARFIRFLGSTASHAEAVYILGDLFEYWAGDDDLEDSQHQEIIRTFKALSNKGTRLYLIHGNRDFLLGEKFAHASGMMILPDPFTIDLYGKKALLSHGDTLCTDDTAYQSFRSQVRSPAWQRDFLALPLADRKRQIEMLRQRSEQEKSIKSMEIMDVNPGTVETMIRTHHYPTLLIHGHTHRPAVHHLNVDGHAVDRWVLGDWYEQGSYLRCDKTGCKSVRLEQE